MISTKGRYALRVMIDLAGQDPNALVPLEQIAQRQGISKKYLELILKTLVQSGLLKGQRGKGGGYQLTRKPKEYPLIEILTLTEGPLNVVACLEPGHVPCTRAADCPTLPIWKGLDKVIGEYLAQYTLADLLPPSSK